MLDSKAVYDTSPEPVIGNGGAIAAMRKYAEDIDRGVKRKPILLYGHSGTGKSMAAQLLANERGWHLVEMNASDYRDQESIDSLLSAASQSRTIFGSRNVILLDEIDELAPRFDRGASSAITQLISQSKTPIILIANDMWDRSISFLRNTTDPIEFKRLSSAEITTVLERYSRKNGINASKEAMAAVAARSNGDARSAINDIIALDNAPGAAIDVVGMRDRKTDIFTTMDKIFFSNTYSAPLIAATSADVDNEMLMRWIDENLPKRYVSKEDLSRAYEMLSMASVFSRRAAHAQYYVYWRYMNVFMTSGVSLSKDNYPDRLKRYSFPKTISELSKSKEARGSKAEIARKLKKRIHTSISRIVKFEMPIIAESARAALKEKDREESVYDFFNSAYGLAPKEVDWLTENVFAIST